MSKPTLSVSRSPPDQNAQVAPTASPPQPMSVNPDLVAAPRAAEECGLRYSQEFNAIRWALEEAVDPATQLAIPMPQRLKVPCLTASQIAKLGEKERKDHLARRAERIAWTRQQWMRVPCWGGIRPPGAEWRYSVSACRTWRSRMQYAEVGQ